MIKSPPPLAQTVAQTVAERLASVPHRFDGLHALRLAELGPAAKPGDHEASPGPTRITAERGLAFAAAPICAVRPGADGTRIRIAFLGLTGPMGVLPQVYSEIVQRAERLRNTALPAFIDLFNHRLATLFLRASEKYRLSVQVQRTLADWPSERSPSRELPPEPAQTQATRPPRPPRIGTDPVSRAMLALAGFGTPHLRGRLEVSDEVILYYAGLFTTRTRPASALQAMLADYLGMPVVVEQFAGRWLPVSAGEQTRLPQAGEPPRFCALGVDAIAGARVWDVQSAFRIVVGPVHYADMLDLMPDQRLLRRLVDLVRVYAGADLLFEVQVVLHRDSVPDLHLDATAGQTAPKLGWNTWAKSLPALDHKRDIVLDPDVVVRQRGRAPAPVPVFVTAAAAVTNPAPSARHT